MGLGLRFGWELKRRWPLEVRERLHAIASSGERFMRIHGLDMLYTASFSDEGLEVFLHPIEEPVRFYAEGGYLVVEARTSSAGPGYHAFVVEWLDQLASAEGFKWQVALGDGDFCDETNYVTDRDFPALQQAMADLFKAIAKYVLQAEANGLSQFNLSLPVGFEVQGDYFAINGLGFWSRHFFDDFIPELFCAWWTYGLDAKALANMAISKMWRDVYWHPPVTEEERRDLAAIQALAARARQFDPLVDLPDRALKDIDVLLSGEELCDIERGEIGFRRRPMRQFLTGGWSICLPGYFYQRVDPDCSQVSIWYGDRTVHVTTLDFDPADLEPQWPRVGETETLRFETEDFRCTATLRPHQDVDVCGWLLQATCNSFSSVAVFSILYLDEGDRSWAEDVLKTVQIRLPNPNGRTETTYKH